MPSRLPQLKMNAVTAFSLGRMPKLCSDSVALLQSFYLLAKVFLFWTLSMAIILHNNVFQGKKQSVEVSFLCNSFQKKAGLPCIDGWVSPVSDWIELFMM